jgi:U3 small nucleolar RNA-associated protein 10
VANDSSSELSLLVEVLVSQSLPGSLDLISSILETLNHIVQNASAAQADVSYIEQLLMSAVENVAEKITVKTLLVCSIAPLNFI